jgi:hypothetical protein
MKKALPPARPPSALPDRQNGLDAASDAGDRKTATYYQTLIFFGSTGRQSGIRISAFDRRLLRMSMTLLMDLHGRQGGISVPRRRSPQLGSTGPAHPFALPRAASARRHDAGKRPSGPNSTVAAAVGHRWTGRLRACGAHPPQAGRAGTNEVSRFGPAEKPAMYKQGETPLVYPPRTNKGASPLVDPPSPACPQVFARLVTIAL